MRIFDVTVLCGDCGREIYDQLLTDGPFQIGELIDTLYCANCGDGLWRVVAYEYAQEIDDKELIQELYGSRADRATVVEQGQVTVSKQRA